MKLVKKNLLFAMCIVWLSPFACKADKQITAIMITKENISHFLKVKVEKSKKSSSARPIFELLIKNSSSTGVIIPATFACGNPNEMWRVFDKENKEIPLYPFEPVAFDSSMPYFYLQPGGTLRQVQKWPEGESIDFEREIQKNGQYTLKYFWIEQVSVAFKLSGEGISFVEVAPENGAKGKMKN